MYYVFKAAFTLRPRTHYKKLHFIKEDYIVKSIISSKIKCLKYVFSYSITDLDYECDLSER